MLSLTRTAAATTVGRVSRPVRTVPRSALESRPTRCAYGAHAALRGAFTLLELILALSLSVLILMAIGMAIQVHLTSLDARRNQLEESQLARSLLRILADDIRGVALRYEQDVSSVEELLKGAGQAALGDLTGGGGSGSGDSGSGGGGSGGGESGGGGSGGGGSGSGGGGGSGGPEGSGEGDGGESSGMESGAEEEAESSQNTQDLSTTVALPTTPGIYGNQYELQIDVSRLPRIEQYQQLVDEASPTAVRDIPSDLKTVTYYVQSGTATGAPALGLQGAALAQLTDPRVSSGLVRRELDRAVTSWAMTNNSAMVTQAGDVLAPEVAGIEFQYFDGYEWRLEWDTEAEQALPKCIQITLLMQTLQQGETRDVNALTTSAVELQDLAGVRYYRLVVQLPVSMPAEEAAESEGTESMEGTGL